MRLILTILLCGLNSAHGYVEPKSWYSASRLEGNETSSPQDLHSEKKVGVGTLFSGSTGLMGLHLQAYLGPDFGIGIGYGGAENLKAFTGYVRHLIANTYLAPYWIVGYARWWNNGTEPITKTSPPYLYEKFLTGDERTSGRFTEHLLYPGLGLQWYKFRGRSAGFSIYSEALLMVDLDDRRIHPGLGIGTFYYF